MKNIFYILCLSFSISMSAVVSSTTLIENAKQLDKAFIEYKGEIVGNVMVRGNDAWINLHDGDNALGVFGEKSIFKNVRILGNYFNFGDTVLIKGYFHRACLQHGGDMDIHAVQADVFKSGYPFKHTLSQKTIMSAVFWLLVAFGLFLFNRKYQN